MDEKTLSALAAAPTELETEHLTRTVLDKVLVSDINVHARSGEILSVAPNRARAARKCPDSLPDTPMARTTWLL